MIATVKLYHDTGLTAGNCLSSASLLVNFRATSIPDVALQQDSDITAVRIEITWNKVKSADYCVINNWCYWITGIVMLSDNVAELRLSLDVITSIGISNLNVIGGWCTRRCVVDDTPYTNVIAENFTPQNPYVIQLGAAIKPAGKFANILVSTVKLEQAALENLAKYYEPAGDVTGELGVTVPLLPSLAGVEITKWTVKIPSIGNKTHVMPPYAAYDMDKSDVLATPIAIVRSLGIESSLVDSYQISDGWCDTLAADATGRANVVSCAGGTYTSSITPTWGVHKNNKVYTGQFHRIVLFSISTGESAEFKPEDVVFDNQFQWSYMADPRPSGCPVIYPSVYRGAANLQMFYMIHGARWSRLPLHYITPSGYEHALNVAAFNNDLAQRNFFSGALSGGISAGGNLLSGLMTGGLSGVQMQSDLNFGYQPVQDAISMQLAQPNFSGAQMVAGGAGGVQGLANYINNVETNNFAAKQQMRVDGNISFPKVDQLADYIGNVFYDMRIRLDSRDMVRFDAYLTRYGYAVDEPLTAACFTGREHFNYVQATGAEIITGRGNRYDNLVSSVLAGGVRIWHKPPTAGAYENNPIIGGSKDVVE